MTARAPSAALLALVAVVAVPGVGVGRDPAASPPAPAGGIRPAGDPDVRELGLARLRHVVRAVAEYGGRVWVGTYGSGLYALDGGGIERYTHASSPLLEDRVNVLAVHRGELWIGTCAGFNVTDGRRWRRQTSADGIAGDIYHAALSDPRGPLWIGTTGWGLSVKGGDRWRTVSPAEGLTDGWINGLAIDRSGALWVATASRIFRRDGARFIEERPPWLSVPAGPTSVACREGEVWVGSAFAGLAMHQGGTWYRPPVDRLLPSLKVNALDVDARGCLWVGTGRGIVRYRPQDGWRTYGRDHGLVDDDVRTICVARGSGRVWAGSFLAGWLYLYDPGRDRFDPVLVAGGPGAGFSRLGPSGRAP